MKKEYSYFQTPRYGEDKNCIVRAFHHAFSISYEESHDLLKAHGRKDGHGFVFSRLMNDLGGSYKGIKYTFHPKPHMTVGSFIQAHQVGTYILRYTGHLFAVINGVVHDSFKVNPNKRVCDYYSIGDDIIKLIKVCKGKTQKSIVLEYHKKGFKTVNEVVAQTGLKKANVAWYFSKLKLN